MIDLLLTILYAGLLILAIVIVYGIVYGIVVIAVLCVRSGIAAAHAKTAAARYRQAKYAEQTARMERERER